MINEPIKYCVIAIPPLCPNCNLVMVEALKGFVCPSPWCLGYITKEGKKDESSSIGTEGIDSTG